MTQKKTHYVISDEHEGFKFEWSLVLQPAFKKPAPMITCPTCNGYGGKRHFGMMDDPEDCWRCNNNGKIADPSFIWDPVPPKELVADLRKVWMDHWNKQKNDEFKLEMS